MSTRVALTVETRQIPTYAIGPESSLPSLGALQRGEQYPYALQTDMATEAQPMPHRIIVIENEYLRAEVLPDLGGRLFRLFDKVANEDAFEFQPSIKPQHIAARGAWFSGGIEFNYGFHGHTVNTFAPVTWALREDADGGASVWVGALTMPIEARWSLRLRLRPGRAVLDNEIHVTSPLALPALMYWWSNSGVQVGDKSEFFYFGPAGTTGGERHSWPFAEGIDMRWWKNRINQSDMFLLQCQRNAMGFYDHGRQHGVACSGDRFDAPGEKYFTWGTDFHGRAWDSLLSDANHSYCEVQRGRNYSQADNDFITSMSEDVWAESWLPLRRTQGFSDDCRELVLHVVQGEGEATVNLQGLEVHQNLTLDVEAKGVSVGRVEIARLAPETLFSQVFKIPAGTHLDRVRVRDAKGSLLLDWKEYVAHTEDWVKPGRSDAQDNSETADKLFAQAQNQRFNNWPRPNEGAQQLFAKILTLDPGHAGTLQALAETDFFAGLYADALAKADRALLRCLNNPDLLALKGWCLFRLGRLDDALEAFGWAGRNEPSRRKGLFGVALVQLKQNNLRGAASAVDRILAGNPSDKWGRLLRVLLLRQTGETAAAKLQLQELLEVDPLWNLLHAEALILGVDPKLANGTRTIGDDSVSAAGLYLDLGWWADAERVLSVAECNEPLSPADRLAHLLFVQHRLGKLAESATTLQALRAASTVYANPWTTQSIAVLEALIALHPTEPMFPLLFGNVLSSRNRQTEAVAAWRRAEALGLAVPVLQANLGRVADLAQDYATAKACYALAAAAAPTDLAIWLEHDRFLASQGLCQERSAAYAALPPRLQERTQTIFRRVEQLLDFEQYADARKELLAREIARGECDGSVLLLHFEACMGLALELLEKQQAAAAVTLLQDSLNYPASLHMGRLGSNPSEATIHAWIGLAAKLANQPDVAARHLELAAVEPLAMPSLASSYCILANAMLGRLHTARGLAREMELFVRGTKPLSGHHFYFHSCRSLAVQSGLLKLARGQAAAARDAWLQGLAQAPDTRMLRLHLRLPQPMLELLVP